MAGEENILGEELGKLIEEVVASFASKTGKTELPREVSISAPSAGRGTATIDGRTVTVLYDKALTLKPNDSVVVVPLGSSRYFVVGRK